MNFFNPCKFVVSVLRYSNMSISEILLLQEEIQTVL